jgi:hypothetical protein
MADQEKIKALFNRANKTAEQFDPEARERILGQLALKANDDPRFREALRKRPDQVVESEAARLNIKASPEDLKEVGEKAREIASRAVPYASETESKAIVFRTLGEIEASFRLTLTLAKALFFVGLGLTIASFGMLVFTRDKVSAAIFGVGGVLSLVLGTVVNTLDRVRDAAANLVQIQMAYLAYYKILDMLGSPAESPSRDDSIAYAQALSAHVLAIIGSLQGVLKPSNQPHAAAGKAGKGKNGPGKENKGKKTKELVAKETPPK